MSWFRDFGRISWRSLRVWQRNGDEAIRAFRKELPQ